MRRRSGCSASLSNLAIRRTRAAASSSPRRRARTADVGGRQREDPVDVEDLRAALEHLEASVRTPADALAPLAYVLSRELGLAEADLTAALRRALLLLAAGGDPGRELGPDARAVQALADDLDAPEPRRRLAEAIRGAGGHASGLPCVKAALELLAADPERAWRWAALALLADELGGG